jgi:hypothetical protein
VFNNCKFNNEFLVIDTESQNTLLGHEEQKVQNNQNKKETQVRGNKRALGH